MITSLHFLRVEIHLSLFCSLNTIAIHRVCLTCCFATVATILRMCQARMECSLRDNFLHFAQPGVQTSLLMMSCVIFMFPGTGCSSSSTNGSSRLKIGRGTSGRTSLKTPEGAHGEPLIASRSSIVVTSGINFTARDLITRPSPLRATMCSSVWKRFPSYVPRCHLSVITPPGTLLHNPEHHSSTEWQELSTMWSFLQSLISRFAVTRCMTLVQNICCVLDNPWKHRRVDRDGAPHSARKVRKKHTRHLLN